MHLKESLLNGLTMLMVMAAAASGVRTLIRGPLVQPNDSRALDRRVGNWDALLSSGHRVGPSEARLTLVEFGDFECPFCAAFAARLDTVIRHHPGEIAVIYHHFPLPYHHLAYPMARAAECAADQGRFGEFYEAAFRRQDSLGVFTPQDYGSLAGVRDTGRFTLCVQNKASSPRVESDVKLARALALNGTPAILIGGVYKALPPTVAQFDSMLSHQR